jgi:hypothetical protein
MNTFETYHPPPPTTTARRPAAPVLISGGSPSGPTNPTGHRSGGETDPTTGMEAGGGAGESWRGGYGGPDPAPNPAGAIRKLTAHFFVRREFYLTWFKPAGILRHIRKFNLVSRCTC